jgi:hypothetical protein
MYDRADCPDHIPQTRAYLLVVAPLFGTKWVHKVLMDRSSGLNIVYMSTLDSMGIQRSQLRSSSTLFHGVVPRMEAVPLGQINLMVTFRNEGNFFKETLTFEVISFPGMYHAILGRSVYPKFMAFPNYTYLKLKMPRTKGVITISTRLQHACECDTECFHFADSLICSSELAAEPVSEVLDFSETSKRATCSFKPMKNAKEVLVSADGRTLHISTTLELEQEEALMLFLKPNLDVFAWKPSYMPGIPKEVTEHKLNIKPSAKPVKQKL